MSTSTQTRTSPSSVGHRRTYTADGWSPTALRAVRRALRQDVERLRRQVGDAAHRIADPDSAFIAGNDDEVALAGSTAGLEDEVIFLGNAQALLDQTEHALQRIEIGAYASCESCGDPVGRARQEAFPRAVTCLSCKRHEERG